MIEAVVGVICHGHLSLVNGLLEAHLGLGVEVEGGRREDCVWRVLRGERVEVGGGRSEDCVWVCQLMGSSKRNWA